MSIRKKIDGKYEPFHAKLTRLYYIEKKTSKETFDKLHSAIWLLHEKETIQAGILVDYEVDEITKKLRSIQIVEMVEALGGETKLKELIKQVLG